MNIKTTSKSFICAMLLGLLALLYISGLYVYFSVVVLIASVCFLIESHMRLKGYFLEVVYRRNGKNSLFLTEFTVFTLIWGINLVGLMIVLTMWQFDLFTQLTLGLLFIYLPLGSLFQLVVGLHNFSGYRSVVLDLVDRFKIMIKDK